MAYIGSNPKYNTSTYTPQSSDPTNPAEGMVFRSDGTTRAKGLWEYKDSNWQQVGTGSGTLNFYDQGKADSAQTTDFSTGNNATFDGGGSFNGTFSKSTTAADLIGGISVFKWVGSATAGNNDDDYIASSAIDIPLGYRGRQLAIKLQYKWDGTDDYMKWVVKDQTNTAILTQGSEFIKQHNSSNTAKTFTLSFFCPADCQQIKIGPQCITGEVSKTLLWDEVIVTPDAFVSKDLVEMTDWASYTLDIEASTTNPTKGTTSVDSAKWRRVGDSMEIEWTYIQTSGGSSGSGNYLFTIPSGYTIDNTKLTVSTDRNAATTIGVGKWNNSNSLQNTLHMFASSTTQLAAVYSNSGGDNVQLSSSNGLGSGNWRMTFKARVPIVNWSASSENIIAYNEFAKNIIVRGESNAGGGITADTTNIDFTEVTDNFNSWNGTQFTVPDTGIYQVTGSVYFTTAADRSVDLYIDTVADGSIGTSSLDTLHFSDIRSFNKGEVISFRCDTNSTLSASTTLHHINIIRIGASQLLGVPKDLICYIKDLKTSGTAGGNGTTGSYGTRDLNTTEGDTSIVSLSSNQFTLGPGTYEIEASCPGFRVGAHKAKVYNITDAADEVLGTTSFGGTGAAYTLSRSHIKGQINLTSSKTFEIQHRVQTATNTSDLGAAATFGDSEVYTIVKIVKKA